MARLLQTLSWVGLFSWVVVSPLHADVLVYRDGASNLHILDSKLSKQPRPISGVIDQYAVGTSVVAYNRGLYLYVATRASSWVPFLVSKKVRSFKVFEDKVVFKSGQAIFLVTATQEVRNLKHASAQISGRGRVRDYKFPNSD